MNDPLFIERDGHRTWLKWHRARRKASDPVFTGGRVLEAMRLGASVEVDLVRHADDGFAVLHDFSLERETTGAGSVRGTSAAALRQLHLRGNDGQPLAENVMLLEDLCTLLGRDPAHPDALLQLDLKEDATSIDEASVANFARSVTPVARNMILSGGDAVAVDRLAKATPGLRTGYDPCYGDSLEQLKRTGDFARFATEALKTAPDAELIYLNYQIVLAAEDAGHDLVAPFHQDGRRIDAWTIREVTPESIGQVQRLLALKVDQITTDDPEGLYAALAQ